MNFQKGPFSYLRVEGTKGGDERGEGGVEHTWKQSTLPKESM